MLDNPQHEELDTLGQLGEYLAHVALMTSTSESDMSTKNTVSLMTVHSAKGLEFDHVFISGLEEEVFPHARAIEEDALAAANCTSIDPCNGAALQEERRLLYVALTRARKNLRLSNSASRMVNGKICTLQPSRFLDELPASSCRRVAQHEALLGATVDRKPHAKPTIQAPAATASVFAALAARSRVT
jgi:DNA helicase-2/ATP-dependent DNA helicase PcrA